MVARLMLQKSVAAWTVLLLGAVFLFASPSAQTTDRKDNNQHQQRAKSLPLLSFETFAHVVEKGVGCIPAGLDKDLCFSQGIGKHLPQTGLTQTLGSLSSFTARGPVHTNRIFYLPEQLIRLFGENPWYVAGIKICHSVQNHALPFLCMGLCEIDPPVNHTQAFFNVAPLLLIFLSNFSKGIEPAYPAEEWNGMRFASQYYAGIVGLTKGYLWFEVCNQLLEAVGMGETARLGLSACLGLLSATSTCMFEGDKLARYGERFLQSPKQMLFATLQAYFVMSLYFDYGMQMDPNSSKYWSQLGNLLERSETASTVLSKLENYIFYFGFQNSAIDWKQRMYMLTAFETFHEAISINYHLNYVVLGLKSTLSGWKTYFGWGE